MICSAPKPKIVTVSYTTIFAHIFFPFSAFNCIPTTKLNNKTKKLNIPIIFWKSISAVISWKKHEFRPTLRLLFGNSTLLNWSLAHTHIHKPIQVYILKCHFKIGRQVHMCRMLRWVNSRRKKCEWKWYFGNRASGKCLVKRIVNSLVVSHTYWMRNVAKMGAFPIYCCPEIKHTAWSWKMVIYMHRYVSSPIFLI